MENPCKGCDRREPGCRDRCPERAKWVAEQERIRRNREKYYETGGYVAEQIRKNRRR